jgi:hypothetical protein
VTKVPRTLAHADEDELDDTSLLAVDTSELHFFDPSTGTALAA